MGYTTTFEGQITIEPPLNEHEVSYLKDFAGTRRVLRKNGAYFVKGTGIAGQGPDTDIIDYNAPPSGQPGLWCQWVPTDDGTAIEWDGGEKFYDSAEWMRYLVDHFLKPDSFLQDRLGVGAMIDPDERLAHFTFDHICNGTIEAEGEDSDDRWQLVVEANVVKVAEAQPVTYGEAREV